MATNDLIILNQILSQKKEEIDSSLTESEFFEIFCADQILKDYNLSYDEIKSGLVGSGADGGIDSIYVFIDNGLVHEDEDLSGITRANEIRLIVIQSKISKSFTEGAITKFIDVSENLFDLSRPVDDFRSLYNEELLEKIDLFRTVYERLASKFPRLNIQFFYATKGDEVHPNVRRKEERLKQRLSQLFSSSTCELIFLGASELYEKARKLPRSSFSIRLAENPISSSGESAYICLIGLAEYYKFIIDDAGNLNKNIFEANVRDYQGSVTVNNEIKKTLRNPHSENFWWLNNGVTALAQQATVDSKTVRLESPEIVNGLQTSEEIFRYFKETNPSSEERHVLVRVIVPQEAESRDRIIKATNSQTAITPSSLRATEKIHRDIEEYLKPYGWYYDRRKNHYKSEGKPIDRIISIPYMAQAVMAVLLLRPDDARARPSSLLNNDEDYKKIYNEEYPINLYLVVVQLIKTIEKYIRTEGLGLTMDRKTRGDIKYHVATHLILTQLERHNENSLAEFQAREIETGKIEKSIEKVFSIYKKLVEANPVASDKVAKSPEFKQQVIEDTEKKQYFH